MVDQRGHYRAKAAEDTPRARGPVGPFLRILPLDGMVCRHLQGLSWVTDRRAKLKLRQLKVTL